MRLVHSAGEQTTRRVGVDGSDDDGDDDELVTSVEDP